MGDQAWVTMSCLSWNARVSGWLKYGCTSIWLTAGTTSVLSINCCRRAGLKFDTPMARTRPPVSSFLAAFHAVTVLSKFGVSGWCS